MATTESYWVDGSPWDGTAVPTQAPSTQLKYWADGSVDTVGRSAPSASTGSVMMQVTEAGPLPDAAGGIIAALALVLLTRWWTLRLALAALLFASQAHAVPTPITIAQGETAPWTFLTGNTICPGYTMSGGRDGTCVRLTFRANCTLGMSIHAVAPGVETITLDERVGGSDVQEVIVVTVTDPNPPLPVGATGATGPAGATGVAGATGPSGSGIWTTVIKTADEARTNSTLAADSTLRFTTVANTQYTVRVVAFLTTNATADAKYRMVHAGTTTRVQRAITKTSTGDIPVIAPSLAAFDVADVILSTTGVRPYVEETIVLQVGASGGLLSFQWAQGTTNAGPCTVLEGSFMEWTPS